MGNGGFRFLFLWVALIIGTSQARGESGANVYDLSLSYENPIRAGTLAPNSCFEFFRVSRNIAPLVNHIFLIAQETSLHGDLENPRAFVFGASKGASDLAYFERELPNRYALPDRLRSLGFACASDASLALDELSRISLRWQERLRSNWYFFSRMIATPVMGRLCNEASEEGIAAITPFLFDYGNEPVPHLPAGWDQFWYYQ